MTLTPEQFKIRLLRATLMRAAKQFRSYEQLHLAKESDEGRIKADINGDMAQDCEDALEETK